MTLPGLSISEWRVTRDTLHKCAVLNGKIRAALAPAEKHWWHVSLRVAPEGLTTTPMPTESQNVEILMDFRQHAQVLSTSNGENIGIPFTGQSINELYRSTKDALVSIGVDPELDGSLFADESEGHYDGPAVERYWRAMITVDEVFKRFRDTLPGETSPVQVFPHHFDLSLNWFSGGLVPGADPEDEENAAEQMGFGFVTGDEEIDDAYFYVTAFPTPDSWVERKLSPAAIWHTGTWTGALLNYDALIAMADPAEALYRFLKSTHAAAVPLMKFNK